MQNPAERSRAEMLFAELLVDETSPSAERLRALCSTHPELADEFERMASELLRARGLMSSRLLPRARAWAIRRSGRRRRGPCRG